MALFGISIFFFSFGFASGPVTSLYCCESLPPLGFGLCIAS